MEGHPTVTRTEPSVADARTGVGVVAGPKARAGSFVEEGNVIEQAPRDRSTRRNWYVVVIAAAVVLAGARVFGGLAMTRQDNGCGSPSGSGSGEAQGSIPVGGIARCDAIRIAAGPASASKAEIETARAMVQQGDPSVALAGAKDRWLWIVEFSNNGGPTGSRYCRIELDFFTGEVVHEDCAIS